MTITQTIEIPADRRVFFEFLAPQIIPTGKAKVELKLTPVVDEQEQEEPPPENADTKATASPTPLTDSLVGILKGLSEDDIGDDPRMEGILRKHAKYLFKENKEV